MDHDYQVYAPGSLDERVADAILVADTGSPTWRGDLHKSIAAMLVDSPLYTSGVVDSETASDDTQSAAPPPPAGSDGWRERIDAGLRSFCSCEPDFTMSAAMRRSAIDHILGQPAPTPPVAPRG